MLTHADDFPIHQTPEPIAYSGTDRNFYDRYFFNGYSRDGELFFAAALGVYPQLNIMDAAFCICHGGRQYNVHASRILHMERMDLQVGPIRLEVLEPLQRHRLSIASDDYDLQASIEFDARHPAIEEPRFTRKTGSQTFMDYTRLTQNGTYSGTIKHKDRQFDLSAMSCWGTRDRSWGLRPVGAADSQPNPYASEPQFFWLWAPLNFPDAASFYHLNADADGQPWNTMGRYVEVGPATALHESTAPSSRLHFQPGTRYAAAATLELQTALGPAMLTLQPKQTFFMKGLGYGHPEWKHGSYHGELAVGFDEYEEAAMAAGDPTNFHIQALVDAELSLQGQLIKGQGVLEQLVIGAYEPYGFKELVDLA